MSRSAIGHHDGELPHGALLVLELAAVLDEVARRQLASRAASSFALDLGHEPAEVAAADVGLGDHAPHAVLAADLRGRLDDAGTSAICASGTRSPPGAGTSSRSSSGMSPRADSGKRTTTANRRCSSISVVACLPGDGRLDGGVDVADLDAVPGQRLAVDDHVELGHAGDLLDLHVPRALDAPQRRRRRGRRTVLSTSRSGPKTLTARSLLTPEMSSFTRSAIGCEKEKRRPGICDEVLLHGLDELGLVPPRAPLLARLEHDEDVGLLGPHRVLGDLGAAGLADHGLDLGELAQALLHEAARPSPSRRARRSAGARR